MYSKDIKFDDDAQNLLMSGVDKLANAVKVTLGPRGNNVMIQSGSIPHVTKDGVTVARNIKLENEFEDMGCQVVKNAASRTAIDAGDGTTTATILTQSIIKYGMKALNSGVNPTIMKKGIDKAVKSVIADLKNMAKPIESIEETKSVATISANNDADLGELIADAMDKVGKDGVITVEPSRTSKTKVTTTEGAQYKSGWVSPYFVTNMRKFEVEYENCLILCTDQAITRQEQIQDIVGQAHQSGNALLIIADDISGDALQFLVTNKVKMNLKVVAVQGDGYGQFRGENIQDAAIMTGAKFLSEQGEEKLNEAKLDHLGSAKKVVIGKSFTTIINGKGDEESIKRRIEELKEAKKELKDDYEIEKMEGRIARFTGGIGVIELGASSDVELREKVDRVDDAIHATKASLEEGIVIGGGTAYIKCLESLENIETNNEDEKSGVDVIKKAIVDPLKQIAENAGDTAEMVVAKVKEYNSNIGYNAYDKTYVDMIESGIIDPVKVTRTALENAASAATMLLSTKCVVVDIVDDFAGGNRPNIVV